MIGILFLVLVVVSLIACASGVGLLYTMTERSKWTGRLMHVMGSVGCFSLVYCIYLLGEWLLFNLK